MLEGGGGGGGSRAVSLDKDRSWEVLGGNSNETQFDFSKPCCCLASRLEK